MLKLQSKINPYIILRNLILVLVYSIIFSLSIVLSYLLRFDFSFLFKGQEILTAIVWIIPLKLVFLKFAGSFRGLLTFFYMKDLVKVFIAMFFSSIVILFSSLVLIFLSTKTNLPVPIFYSIPKGVILSDFMISMIGICSFRLSMRVWRERSHFSKNSYKQRIAIIGAGSAGAALAANLISRSDILPVVFLDIDKKKIGKEISGIPVITQNDSNIVNLKNTYGVQKVIIALPSATPSLIGDLVHKLKRCNLETNIVPSALDLASGKVKVSQTKHVEIEDILGRDPVSIDDKLIDEMISGKVILVTGAGGSIGSELCVQIASKGPDMLIICDHCEVQLYKIEQHLVNNEYGIRIKSVVASVTDPKRMRYIFDNLKPDIIFHAAAHKHVPMMEFQPGEALKNNTYGTWNLANLAGEYGVEKFLLISTDKAVNPTNVMGATKRLAEMSVQSLISKYPNTNYMAVRFGNVLGSSGSVIPTFKAQIEKGGPVTITHPDVTRYFMTIPEAVSLVLECAANAKGGEIFVLDMGSPIKIIDVAYQLIRLSGYEPEIDIPIKVVGLRPGEKLYEELQHKDESMTKTPHRRIFVFNSQVPSYEFMKECIDEIANIYSTKTTYELKKFIFSKVPEYKAQFYD